MSWRIATAGPNCQNVDSTLEELEHLADVERSGKLPRKHHWRHHHSAGIEVDVLARPIDHLPKPLSVSPDRPTLVRRHRKNGVRRSAVGGGPAHGLGVTAWMTKARALITRRGGGMRMGWGLHYRSDNHRIAAITTSASATRSIYMRRLMVSCVGDSEAVGSAANAGSEATRRRRKGAPP